MHARWPARLALVAALIWLLATPSAAQPPVSVNAAVPPEGAQDTVGLLVRITGKNFAPGARADFFRSGTSDPAGVTVRSTRVVSSGEIEATVDIAVAAALSTFDIRVTNSNGRSGKGSDLFTVVEKGARNACMPPTQPIWLAGPALLNGVVGGQPRFSGRMGDDVAAAPLIDAAIDTVLVVATAGGAVVVSLVQASGSGATVLAQLALAAPQMTPRSVALGDINGDGAPDVIAGDRVAGRAVLFLSSRSGDAVSYSNAIAIAAAGDTEQFGADVSIAAGHVAIAQWGVSAGKTKRPGLVHLYEWNGTALGTPIAVAPALSSPLKNDDGYGTTVRLADVTGDGTIDVVAGAGGREIGALSDAGEVYIFPGPSFDASASPGRQAVVIRAASPTSGDHYGVSLGTGSTLDSRVDVIAGSLWSTSNVRAEVTLNGTTTSDTSFTARPPLALAGRFGEPGFEAGLLDGDAIPDLIAPAPDAACGGAVHLYRGAAAGPGPRWQAPLSLQAAPEASYTGFGSSAALAESGTLRVLVVGEKGRTVGGVDDPGQLYVFRVTP